MPLTRRAGQGAASPMQGCKAMADGTENGGAWRGRRWAIAGVTGAQGLTGLSIQVTEFEDDGDQVVLVRNALSAGRMWRGAFINRTDGACRDVAVEIRFHDRNGATVGAAEGRAARLEPGQTLELEAPAPAGAVGLQVRALRWRTGEASVELGPYGRLGFGYLQH